MDYECNCRVCNNDDLPEYDDEHEVDACEDCHEAGFHEEAIDWDGGCVICAVIVRQEEADAERMDMQKGDNQ